MAGDVILFPEPVQSRSRRCGLGAWIFHVALVADPVPPPALFHLSGPGLAVSIWSRWPSGCRATCSALAALFLFWRRLALPRTLYISDLPDYFALALLGAIAGTASWCSYWAHVYLVDVKAFMLGLLTLHPVAAARASAVPGAFRCWSDADDLLPVQQAAACRAASSSARLRNQPDHGKRQQSLGQALMETVRRPAEVKPGDGMAKFDETPILKDPAVKGIWCRRPAARARCRRRCAAGRASQRIPLAIDLPAERVPDWQERGDCQIRRAAGEEPGAAGLTWISACAAAPAPTNASSTWAPATRRTCPVARAELMRQVYRRYFTPGGRLFPEPERGGRLRRRDAREWYTYFYQCSECRRCSVFCPYGIDTAEITMAAREIMAASASPPST